MDLTAEAAGGLAIALPTVATAQKSEIHDLRGSVKVNGKPIDRKALIVAGDLVETGSDGYIVFVIGDDAFMLRSRSELRIEKAQDSLAVSALRLLTGALGAVFKAGAARSIKVMNVTAGIRGTGVYMETRAQGTYFCTCFGKVELNVDGAPNDREWVEAQHHTPRWILAQPKDGALFQSAAVETHTDEEMDILEKCVGRRAPWVK